jgi:hypothetical protein
MSGNGLEIYCVDIHYALYLYESLFLAYNIFLLYPFEQTVKTCIKVALVYMGCGYATKKSTVFSNRFISCVGKYGT